MTHLRFPVGGARLYEALCNGRRPSVVYLFIGEQALDKQLHFERFMGKYTLALLPGELPCDYDWPVINCEIMVHNQGYMCKERAELIASALLENGAKRVIIDTFALNGKPELPAYYYQE